MIPAGVKIWAAAAPVDMRRGFVGLAEATREQLAQDPGNGALYVFTNKRRNRVTLCIPPLHAGQVQRLGIL